MSSYLKVLLHTLYVQLVFTCDGTRFRVAEGRTLASIAEVNDDIAELPQYIRDMIRNGWELQPVPTHGITHPQVLFTLVQTREITPLDRKAIREDVITGALLLRDNFRELDTEDIRKMIDAALLSSETVFAIRLDRAHKIDGIRRIREELNLDLKPAKELWEALVF